VSVRSVSVAAPPLLALRLPPRWLVGWWAVGRIAVIATALALRPSIWFLGRWDGRWYRMIAQSGYLLLPGRESDPAFFPLYPILLRGVHALGIGWGVAGPLLSDLDLLLALALFYLLTRELFGDSLAQRATIYLAIFPLGYVFSMTYPESLVLGLVAAAPLAALRRRWWLAAICGAAAALARPEALLLALPLAGVAWEQWRTLEPTRRGAALAAVVAPAAALVSYPLYLGTVLHDPLAWSRAQATWGRSFRLTGPFWAIVHLGSLQNDWRARDVAFFVLYLGLLFAAWRLGTPLAWLAAAAGVVVLPIFSGTFESVARFGLLAPPLYWGLASLGASTRRDLAIRALSLLLLIGGTISLKYTSP
jgi:hypothetical protein